jgi:hypothetical protein
MTSKNNRVKRGTVSDIVKKILCDNAEARSDDYVLYTDYLRECGYSATLSFFNITKLVQRGDLPPIESVGRVRRKLQSEYPLLRGCTYSQDCSNE